MLSKKAEAINLSSDSWAEADSGLQPTVLSLPMSSSLRKRRYLEWHGEGFQPSAFLRAIKVAFL